VTVVKKAGSVPLAVGPFAVMDPTTAPDTHAYEGSSQPRHTHDSISLKIQTLVALPPGLTPADIARISVANGSGNDVLTGIVAP